MKSSFKMPTSSTFKRPRAATLKMPRSSTSITSKITTSTLMITMMITLTMHITQSTASPSSSSSSSSSSDPRPTHDSSSVTIRQSEEAREINSFVGGAGGASDLGDPYLGDFDKEWAKMSGRLQSQKCVDIPANLTLCQNIGYERMMLPNLLSHDSLSEVTSQARSWVPLLGLHCHPDTKVFLCSLFSPVCLDRRIYPCRTLCEGVRDNCRQRMAYYGFDWPKMLRCSQFPEDNDLCIKLVHDIKPDNKCSACRHPMTYEAIVDNYCRAEFVSRVKIDHTENHGPDKIITLKKSKRYYKTENLTEEEQTLMRPVLLKGSSCSCDVLNDTNKRLLLMGSHNYDQPGDPLVVQYVVEFASDNQDFRRAFKELRKDNVCKSIIEELSQGEMDGGGAGGASGDKGKDDGICRACRMPMSAALIVENYCLSDFVLRVSVTGVESQEGGHQVLKLKKSRRNYKRGVIGRKEIKSMVPLLDGSLLCRCPLVENKKARYLVFGTKQDDTHIINYVTEFDNKNREFKKGLRAIRKTDACLNILRGGSNSGLGGSQESSSSNSASRGGKKSGGKKGRRKGNKKRRKGRKGRKGKKGKKGNKKGGKKNRKNNNGGKKRKNGAGGGENARNGNGEKGENS